MTKPAKPALRPWPTALLMTASLWLFLILYSDIHFGVNDDMFIMRAFTGFAPGGAPTFHLYIHGLYAWPLHWLNALCPGVAWFSVLEIALLSLAMTTLLKSVLQCFARGGCPRWAGIGFCLAYLLLYGAFYFARITYTTTAAMLGAAAAAQILSVDCRKASDRSILRSMGFALLLAVLCYGLRQMTALPALAYCGLAFLLRFLECFGFGKKARRSPKPLLIVFCLTALVMGGLALGREMEIDGTGQRDYLNWQQARISVLDYIDLEKLPPEALEGAGWTENKNQLLIQWNTMDEALSTQSFRYLRENWYNSQTRTTAGAAIEDLRTRSPEAIRSMIALLVMGLGCLGLLLCSPKENKWPILAVCGAGTFCLAFFCYLALQGRLPYRAVTVPVFPAAALVWCLLGEHLPPLTRKKQGGSLLTPALCGLLALLTLWHSVPTVYAMRRIPSQWDYNAHEDLDRQALAHPDLLLLYSTELVNDMRMFPDVSGGVPGNVMFWGGWGRGSPEYRARLAAFGIDGEHFTAADWLRPELRFVSLKEEPNEALVRYLREEIGPDVMWEREKVSAGLYFYRFYRGAVPQ